MIRRFVYSRWLHLNSSPTWLAWLGVSKCPIFFIWIFFFCNQIMVNPQNASLTGKLNTQYTWWWDCVVYSHNPKLVAIPWSVRSVNSFLIEPNSWVLSLFLHVTMFALSFISVLHECGLLVFHMLLITNNHNYSHNDNIKAHPLR